MIATGQLNSYKIYLQSITVSYHLELFLFIAKNILETRNLVAVVSKKRFSYSGSNPKG